MLREIGSNFWYCLNDINDINDLHSPTQFGCDGNDYAWLSTGRSATRFILDTIERHHNTNKVVVLPPFTCHTVIEPFIERRYEIFAYNINKTFSASAEDIINVARKHRAGVILFHRYFGFDTANNIDDMVEKARAEGIVTIEDCTQILYSSFRKSDSDYKVGSIRKWCGVPDGGFAVCRVGEFINKPKDIDLQLQGAKSKAAMLKYDYIVNGIGEKRDFLDCFQNAENILDAQNRYYKISDLSARIQSNLNVDQMKLKRRKNYEMVVRGLENVEGVDVVLKKMNANEVPLYCPVLCRDRVKIQILLRTNSIYAPIVWPKAKCCPNVNEDAEYLYKHLLCIPIDQRYDSDDMERIVEVLSNKVAL